MDVALRTPTEADLGALAELLASWQEDGGPVQLHPGDLGWFSMRGAGATARATRTWSRGGDVLAIGLLDGADLLRLALAPSATHDVGLARAVADHLDDRGSGVLPAGPAVVEARGAAALRDRLTDAGWAEDEPWTPLYRDLTAPVTPRLVAGAGLTVEQVDVHRAGLWMEVHWSAFRDDPFGAEQRDQVVDWWSTMMSGPFAERHRGVALTDSSGAGVAVVGVWSAGPGRPGLVEPLGVHRDQRGHGYGAAACEAGLAALRAMGSSSAVVCAESSNRAALAAYAAAGFRAGPEVTDLARPG